MSNANDKVQVDFGHRQVTVTVGFLREQGRRYDHVEACRVLRFKTTTKPELVRGLIADIAGSVPGAATFECHSCGSSTYGPEGVIGTECCEHCYELAGIDNQLNDDGREPTADEVAEIEALVLAITAAGGDADRALASCHYIPKLEG